MSRSTVAVVVATALVGVLGGGVAAVVRDQQQKAHPDVPTAGQNNKGQSNQGNKDPGTHANVLYAGAKTIHDGRASVHYQAPFDTPDRLVRVPSGYLIAHNTSPQEPSSRVYFVSASGQTNMVADILGRFDVDEAGDRIVATDLESGKLRTWSLDGTVSATWEKGPLGLTRPVWSGKRVFASQIENSAGGESGQWRMWQWDPSSGQGKRLQVPGLAEMDASRDGSLLAGGVGIDGFATVESNACLSVTQPPGTPDPRSWDTCDWRLNGGHSDTFNPSGTLVLTVPSETDGFGPGRFATFSASEGPSRDLHAFDTPQWTMDANWLDDDTLVLIGATDANLDANTGKWIKTCTLQGDCADVTTRAHGDLVVGEQG